jgi:hypothetical protein
MILNRSASEAFGHNREWYESLYHGEPAFPGAPAPEAIPWDIRQAQPRLMEPAQTDAVVMKKYAPGHSSSILWWLLEDFAQPVELDLVFKTRVIHLAVSLAAIC